VDAVIQDVLPQAGRINLLVNNAGFGVAPAAAEESSIEHAQAIFDTNFMGIVRMTRAVVPHMRQKRSGRIINIGSVLGFRRSGTGDPDHHARTSCRPVAAAGRAD